MKKIYSVIGRLSVTTLRVKDLIGREHVLYTDKSFNVGDFILVINGVVVSKIYKRTVSVVEV